MPKVVDVVAQRRQIRQAALRVFGRRGAARTGLAHVAAAAGMGRSSLYHYYPDKDALVRDLVRDLLAAEESLFSDAAHASGRPRERIETLTVRLTGLFEEWTTVGRLLLELRSRDARLFRPFFRRVREVLASLLVEGQRAGEVDAELDPPLAAATLIGAVDGLLLQHAVDPTAFPDPDALRTTLVRVVDKVVRP